MGTMEAVAEQYEYLFLDLEWNQPPGTTAVEDREPVQIGIVAADSSLQKNKTFSKAIQLPNPGTWNPETFKIIHMPLSNVMEGHTADVIWEKMAQTFPECRYLVVWSRDTNELFRQSLKKCKKKTFFHKIIILQEVLELITGNAKENLTFENALDHVGIEYNSSFLHYAKHDANYLYQLYARCFRAYTAATKEEYLVANPSTGKLHTPDCFCVKKMNPQMILQKPMNAVFKGFTPCKFCSGKKLWARFTWQLQWNIQTESPSDDTRKFQTFPLTEKRIEAICRHFQVSYNISNNIVFIRTLFSSWIVYLKDGKVVKLLHENYKPSRSAYFRRKRMKCLEGYHVQKLPSEHFYNVIHYIKIHDDGLVKRLSQKSNIEKLLETVERERKDKENPGKKEVS